MLVLQSLQTSVVLSNLLDYAQPHWRRVCGPYEVPCHGWLQRLSSRVGTGGLQIYGAWAPPLSKWVMMLLVISIYASYVDAFLQLLLDIHGLSSIATWLPSFTWRRRLTLLPFQSICPESVRDLLVGMLASLFIYFLSWFVHVLISFLSFSCMVIDAKLRATAHELMDDIFLLPERELEKERERERERLKEKER